MNFQDFREEQMRFIIRSTKLELCRHCRNRKFDKARGLFCGLTDDKPQFEETCPDYVEDKASVEIDKEREKGKSNREWEDKTKTSLFIYITVGVCVVGVLGMVLTGFLIGLGIVSATQLAVITLMAALTGAAFYKHSLNAMSLAKSYIMLALINVMFSMVMTVCVFNGTESMNVLWLTIYVIIEVLLAGGCIYNYLKKSDKGSLNSEIKARQAGLAEHPVDCGDGVLYIGIKKEGPCTVVDEYIVTDAYSRIHDVSAMRERTVAMKYEYLSATKENYDSFAETCFKLGWSIEVRYFDPNKALLGSYSISPEEYYRTKNLTAGKWVCPKDVLEKMIVTEKATYPTNFSPESERINVALNSNATELVYEIRFGLMAQEKLLTMSSSDLLNYVTENWDGSSTPLRELAEVDGLIITYNFKTSTGTDLCTVKVGPEKYSQLKRNDVLEMMRSKSDSDLLQIIENPENYTYYAEAAARQVLDERGVKQSV